MKKHFPIVLLNILTLLLLALTGCATFRGFGPEPEKRPTAAPVAVEIDRNSLRVGMEMNEVTNTWGEPWEVQVAGDPSRGNQKWSYFSGIQSRWDSAPIRVVYFEAGQVVGWDTSSN